jgi:hypothetical protein
MLEVMSIEVANHYIFSYFLDHILRFAGRFGGTPTPRHSFINRMLYVLMVCWCIR